MEKEKNVSRMASAPVGRLMLSMGIPMILSMVLQAVYNIVDSAFVSNMKENGEEAINALTLAFPFVFLFVYIAEKSPEYNWLVWTAFPAAEILTAAVGAFLLKRMYRNKVAVLK